MTTSGDRTGRPRGILVVLVDDQGYGDLGRHGHPEARTPGLDALADSSVRCTDFHAMPMCTPTRGSLFTGLDALRHGATNVSSGRSMLDVGRTTLPEILREAGYRTGLFGKWHLGDNHPYRPHERGFDRAVWFPSSHVSSAPDHWRNDYFDTWLRSDGGPAERHEGYCTDILFAETFSWIEDRVRDNEPFFACLSLNALHKPLIVADEYREPYLHLGPVIASYLGMLANLDDNITWMEERLTELGISEDTLIVYLSDNGGAAETAELYNAGMRGSKTELWEGGHRVPAFVRWPAGGIGGIGDIAGGADMDELAVVQDILPTLLDVCGIPTANLELDGISLVPALRGTGALPIDRTCVIQYSRMGHPEPEPGDAVVLRGRFRLMVTEHALYDVRADPGQTEDISHRHPDLVTSMIRHYFSWWHALIEQRTAIARIVLGTDAEPVVALSPADWRDVFLDQQRQVLEGLPINSHWNVQISRPGRYRFELRRWPREADAALSAAVPAHSGAVCEFMSGRALPVAAVRMRLAGIDVRAEAAADEVSVVFEVDLHAGPAKLETWLLDSAGDEIAGAYYVYAERMSRA